MADVTEIRTATEYQQALLELEHLMENLTLDDSERLGDLAERIEDYESREFPIELPTPVDAIKFRMDQQGLVPSDLIPYIGTARRVAEVLDGLRPMTMTMVHSLHRGLGISLAVLRRGADS